MAFTEVDWELVRDTSGAYVEIGPATAFVTRANTLLRVCEFLQAWDALGHALTVFGPSDRYRLDPLGAPWDSPAL
eukprot:4755883-Alexandrium_andersonii.AAC.1